MSNGIKAAIGIGAIALALKVYSDSQKMAAKLKAPTSVPGGTVSVGGTTLPTPTPKEQGPVLDGTTLTGGGGVVVNPAVGYEKGYWGEINFDPNSVNLA